MSKLSIKILAVAFAAMLAAAGYADAKGGGGGGRGGGGGGGGHGARGGGHHGGGHFARGGGHRGGHIGRAHVRGGHHIGRARIGRTAGRAFAQPRFNRNRAPGVQTARAGGPGNALNSRALARTLRHTPVLNPGSRAQFAAGAAMAGWAYGRYGNGWWRHGNGGYGWVGPLFWPFAYYDLYDYAIWGPGFGAPFWGYGYDDIYTGMFAPYGYNELRRYLPPRDAMGRGAHEPLAEMCGDDSREVAGLPVDLIEQAVDPTEPQRAALDDLARASIAAAQGIKAACPTTLALTAPGRLASMRQRIEAMISAVTTVQPALDKFYALLTDEQKLRLNALGEDQRRRLAARNRGRSLAGGCNVAEPAALQWPAEELEARLRPTDAQRTSLAALTETNARAAKMLRASCSPEEAVTPPARLAAVSKRLDSMLQAVTAVRGSLEEFYATLDDEQKAQFEAIGPRRTAASDPRESMQRRYRR